ncbi:hypothetical protein, partial [Endozoicomonas sp. SESOKO2]|uniref:hypothetical protein n=1 Tax=Endozoicomonas sp. SESOKO2 TaxID=2828743 RepID=UPI0021484244
MDNYSMIPETPDFLSGAYLLHKQSMNKQKPRSITQLGFCFIQCLAMTYSHMGKPHNTIGGGRPGMCRFTGLNAKTPADHSTGVL